MNCNKCGRFWEECECDASAQSSAKGATLTDVLAAADNVIANLQNMTDEQLIEALENVEDDSVSRAILGC
jgi:hypothetical protein